MTGHDLRGPLPLLLFALAALVLLLAPTPVAQTQADQEDLSSFVDTSHTNVVNVEVYVTDKDGKPVTDLGADDFEVFENGKPMAVSYFSSVRDGRPVERLEPETATPETAPSAEPELPSRPQVSELPPEQRLHVIVYVDNFNLRPETRNRVLRRLRSFLSSSIRPDDRVMVVSYDRSLHLRQPFTSDMSQVGRAIDELQSVSGSQTTRDNERDLAIREISGTNDEISALQDARSYADSVSAEMRFTLDAMRRQIETLSGLQGRKALIYISDGLPQVVGEDLFIYVSERFPRSGARLEAGNYDLGRDFRQLVAHANAAGVTFYTLEARGLRPNRSVSAEFAGTTQGGGLPFIDSVDEANLQEPLYMMADDTGGQTIIGTNAVESGLKSFLDDFRNYYFLGYEPGHFGDGRYHKIEVKVKRKGLKVRHRNGYRDQTFEARLTDSTVATLVHGTESNPLGIDFDFGKYQRDGNNLMVPVEIAIPIDSVTLVPQGENLIGRLKVAVAVMDSDGDMSPVQQQPPVTLTIPKSEMQLAQGKHYTYALVLALRPGFSRVAVSLRDEISNSTSYVRRTISIGS